MGVATSHKRFFSCISTSGLSCVQRFFSKMMLVKTSLRTQLKQTNKLIDFIFQPKVHKVLMILLKRCNPDMQILTSSSVFVFIFNKLGCCVTF